MNLLEHFTLHTAQLPERGKSQDRVFSHREAVVVLDGVTPLQPVDGDPARYADQLGRQLIDALLRHPQATGRQALQAAIARTCHLLGLGAQNRPSATVSLVRRLDDELELTYLGDSPVLVAMRGERQPALFTDRRLAQLAPRSRQQARAMRNTPGGYWIAETDPTAASQAFRRLLPLAEVQWVMLATDGAFDPISYLGPDWQHLAQRPESLHQVLAQCQRWEAQVDPDRHLLDRSKRHDDKTLALLTRPG